MTNPYAPPEADESPSIRARDVLKARVSRPATALIVMASIHSVFVAISLVSAAVIIARGGDINGPVVVGLTILCLQFTCLILIAIGAAKLGFLESYRLARLGSWLACIPLITPFFFLGIPFGIWSLLLLADPTIRAAFPDVDGHSEENGS